MIDDKKRHRYSEMFKRQIVEKLMKSGMPISSFAASISIDRTNLQKWKKIYGDEFTMALDDVNGKVIGFNEFVSLKKEVESLKETVDRLRTVVKKNFENKYVNGQ